MKLQDYCQCMRLTTKPKFQTYNNNVHVEKSVPQLDFWFECKQLQRILQKKQFGVSLGTCS